MRIILVSSFIIIGIIISVSGSYASVLYTTPAMFPPPDKIIAPWSQNAKGPGEEVFREAVNEFKKGEYSLALDKFESLLINHPNSEASSIASLYAGSIYYWMAVKEEKKDVRMLMSGLKSFQYGIRTHPAKEKANVPVMLLEIGKIYIDLNLIAEAKGSFNRIIQEFPSSGFAAKGEYMLVLIHMKEGNYNDALSVLNVLAVKYDGEMEKERVFVTGEIFLALHEFGDSKRFYDEGIRKWPAYVKGNPKILLNYSECQFQNGEIPSARAGFFTLFNLYPKDKHAGFALKRAGETFALDQKMPVAEKIYLDVITFFPKSNDAWSSMLALGDLKLKSKSADTFNDDSLKYYKDVETLSGNDLLVASARYKTAGVLEKQGKYRQALSMYLDIIGHPDKSLNDEISQLLTDIIDKIGMQIEDRLGRSDRLGALKLYQTYYKNNLTHVRNEDLLMKMAVMHESINLHNDAFMIYENIIKRNGSRTEQALFKSGKLYARTGDYRKSVDMLERYITEYPKGVNVSEARALAGEGHNNLKEYEKASNHFYAVIRDAPNQYPYVNIRLAAILQNTGQYQESADVLRDMLRGIQKNQDIDLFSQGYVSLGNSYYGMTRYQDAIDAYRSGLIKGDLKEGSETVEYMIGDCLLRLDRTDEARKIFTRLSSGTNKLVKQVSEERLKDITSAAEDVRM